MARKLVARSARKFTTRDLISIALKGLLAAAAFGLTVQVSVAGEFRSVAPQLALKFVPYDAEARAKLASLLASNNPLPEARQAARALAHDALRRDPVNVVAMRALGQARATEGSSASDQAAAARLFDEAQRLSRRDHVSQLWLAEYYLRRQQLPQVLRHFDIVLRTSSSGQDTLFPLLAAAAADRRIADALIARMRRRPDWALPFANHLLGGHVPAATGSYIFQNSLDPKVPGEMALIEALMQRMAAAGDYRAARQIYDHFDLAAGDGRALLNEGGFEPSKAVAPFAWSYVEEADLWAAPEPQSTGGRALILSASSGRAGDVARQLIQLSPGTYRLSAKFGNVPLEANQRPAVSVRCAGDGETPLGSARAASGGAEARTAATSFTVPGNCAFQWVMVSLSGPEGELVDLPWVDDVAIARTGT